MNKVLITYADKEFAESKKRLCAEADGLGFFDDVISYGPSDVSKEVSCSAAFQVKRGGGLWSWKPDVILQTMKKLNEGDYLFYCDAGCTLRDSKEWQNNYFKDLENYDIRAIKIFQKNKKWIRQELVNYFCDNPHGWLDCFQTCATIALKVTPFTKMFVKEWRDIIVEHPKFVMDVEPSEMVLQSPDFIENRHDQAVYSSLIYKYLGSGKIVLRWEHIEGLDVCGSQAIVASRLKNGETLQLTWTQVLAQQLKWLIKKLVYFFN